MRNAGALAFARLSTLRGGAAKPKREAINLQPCHTAARDKHATRRWPHVVRLHVLERHQVLEVGPVLVEHLNVERTKPGGGARTWPALELGGSGVPVLCGLRTHVQKVAAERQT